jgi:pyruvate dehydrogenase E2 component (dihydrolipoamide acetyltransferase)
MGTEPVEERCCEEGHGAGAPALDASGAADVRGKFQDFLQTANAPGALDAHAKQAVAIALSTLAKCEPCLRMHMSKAREMGMTEQEIDEAAWMAIAFGGSPVMMFYNTIREG